MNHPIDKMPDPIGQPIDPSRLQFQFLGDLLYHEGPFISHLTNQKNENFFLAWCDKDNMHHRWMLYKTTVPLLRSFFEKRRTLRDLILDNPDGHVLLIDIDGHIDWKKAFRVQVADLDPDYLPGDGSGYDETGFEPYLYELKRRIGQEGNGYGINEETSAAVVMEPKPDDVTKPPE